MRAQPRSGLGTLVRVKLASRPRSARPPPRPHSHPCGPYRPRGAGRRFAFPEAPLAGPAPASPEGQRGPHPGPIRSLEPPAPTPSASRARRRWPPPGGSRRTSGRGQRRPPSRRSRAGGCPAAGVRPNSPSEGQNSRLQSKNLEGYFQVKGLAWV